jgi:NADPH:quinone reductase-like Zn-dependent oxidoreductase
MRLITQATFGGPDVLEMDEAPPPTPGPGEVVVTTTAIGVNPVDAAVRAGHVRLLGDPPFTLGWDIAGAVSAVGPGVTELAVGDRVYGMPAFPAQAAAYAEQVRVKVSELARIPDRLDDRQAAALPLVGRTAYQALVEVGQVGTGHRVLVQAGGGGVGHLAIQIARALGARVVATASSSKVDFVAGLGAEEIVNYEVSDYTTIEPVDLALDPLGGANTARTLKTVRAGGTLALLVGTFDDAIRPVAAARGVRLARISVVPHEASLNAITELAASGRLVPHVSATFALDQAADAHRHLGNGVRGKVVLVP